MSRQSILRQVKGGFRLAGGGLLAFAWFVLALGGLGIARSQSPHRPAVGWALLAVAAVIFFLTMDRWARFFPGVLVWGILGGIVTTVSGHVVNHPEVAVPRWEGAVMTLLIATGAFASQRFEKRRLRPPDRIALVAFAFCFFWQVEDFKLMLPGLTIGIVSLAAAWANERVRDRGNDPGRAAHSART
jgi:hypothetical protein